MQKSVFEAFLTPEERETLLRRLNDVLDREADTVRIYRLCESCNKEITIVGAGEQVEIVPYIII